MKSKNTKQATKRPVLTQLEKFVWMSRHINREEIARQVGKPLSVILRAYESARAKRYSIV